MLLLIVSVGGLGRLLQADPQTALRINPFNVDARVAALNADLNEGSIDPDRLRELEAQVRSAIAYDPVDARLRSLLGEIQLRQNKAEEGQAEFFAALRISKTEQLALRRLIVGALQTGKTADAVRYIDLFSRRWPAQFQDVMAVVPPLLQDPAAYEQMVKALQASPPWRPSLIRALVRYGIGLPLANRLLLDLNVGSTPPTAGELKTVVTALVQAGDLDTARRLFLFTLPEDEWDRVGLVFNGHFKPSGASLPFDWIYRNTAAAYLSTSSESPQNGMTVRFLDKPARDVELRQTLSLEPGHYRLKLDASAATLKLPRGLYWRLRCLKPNKDIARIDIAEGTYRNQIQTAEFDNTECAAQVLELVSGLKVDSWLYRYSGRVSFHELSIERIDEPGQQE